ncbi:MAG: UTP--glucose-1-phosphate uridylyltransferase (EC [uncultured Thiotrichaceae bacterium]|uniref:UTP--glucose-1-phosphate uridylyltransferase n=1 Tax=uncultured Thiotrichaceae bacterium TaxID=298394 RepID=A0A6S6UFL4_9GAMM|nr:MAG: UTP--glucose-1-phosphate uridylyltransferase (EC [uncultured Thiotrichaceae bacterium]
MNSKITTAVIPVAGFGTRMLPASKAIPKEMLPVVDKPLIQYIVEECVAAGIEQIVLVTHSSKAAIENHFDTNFELETSLENKNKTALLKAVQETIPDHVSITAVRQSEAKGLGHAVLCAHPVVGDNPVAVLLPDVLIDNMESDLAKDNLARMLSDFAGNEQSQIMVEPVPMEKVSSYGVVDISGVTVNEGEYAPMTAVVEKPPVEEAPSNLSVVGRYVLSATIWEHLRNTPRGAGNEIQLTDAIAMLMDSETVNACHITGQSHDCGSKEGYMKANLVYGFRHPEIGETLKAAAKGLI